MAEQTPAPLPNCDLCGAVQTELGGLLFGCPRPDGSVQKRHLCVRCVSGIGSVRPRVDADTRAEIEALIERWKEREVLYEAARNYGIVLDLDHRDIARNARAAELLSLLLGEVPDGD